MTIIASNQLKDLTGKGMEYLTDPAGKQVRLAFYNGQMVLAVDDTTSNDRQPVNPNIDQDLEPTLIAA